MFFAFFSLQIKGTIDFDEFKLGLERLSIYLSVHAIERLMKEMITDGGGGGGANSKCETIKSRR
jgi:hypothetical protein